MTKAETADASLAALVDELGDLEMEVAPYKLKLKRLELLRNALRASFADGDATEPCRTAGTRWEVLLGPCGAESTVDTLMLMKLIGAKRFCDVATVSLKALAGIGSDVLAAVVTSAQTGTRSITAIPKR